MNIYKMSRIKWDLDRVKEYVSNYGMTVNETEYRNMHTKMSFVCVCGDVFVTTFNKIVYENKTTCTKCSHDKLRKERAFSYDFVKNYIENKGCELLEYEYVNANKKIKIKCTCGKIYETTFHSFKDDNKYRCDTCSKKSLGENEIERVLINMGFNYIRQYKFKDCVKKSVAMPFDFYIDEINTCIEYDGEQHFKPVSHWGGEARLKQQQANDKFKDLFCKNNSIKLIRIPYWDFCNIEGILKKELN